LRLSYVGRSSRIALVLTLAAALAALAAATDLDAEVGAVPKVDGRVPLLKARAGHGPAARCSEPDVRSLVAQRLQSAPFLVRVPADRSIARGIEHTECHRVQFTTTRPPTHRHG
jgi:hypothetical protein